MPARKFPLHRLAEGRLVEQELRCARGLRAQLGQRHTVASCRGFIAQQPFLFLTTVAWSLARG